MQDAAVRALRFFSSLRNDDARAWLLTIVRNTWYARFSKVGSGQDVVLDDTKDERPDEQLDPEALVMQRQAVEGVRCAIEELPVDFREVIVLRELEGMSYKDIAAVVGIPVGTVMSRLSRARSMLRSAWNFAEARTQQRHHELRRMRSIDPCAHQQRARCRART